MTSLHYWALSIHLLFIHYLFYISGGSTSIQQVIWMFGRLGFDFYLKICKGCLFSLKNLQIVSFSGYQGLKLL